MNPQVWWYVARASGFVAWGLVTLSVCWGLILSTRMLGRRVPPAWLLDLHRFLGGLAVSFTAVHLAGLVADSWVYFGWSELFVPMASPVTPGAVTWGIVALYLLVAVELTAIAMRRLPKKLWRPVHYSSFIMYVTSTVHALQSGTDVGNPVFRVAALASVQVLLFLTLVRIIAQRRAGQRQSVPRPVTPKLTAVEAQEVAAA